MMVRFLLLQGQGDFNDLEEAAKPQSHRSPPWHSKTRESYGKCSRAEILTVSLPEALLVDERVLTEKK
jgi:hypothetical protein